jgi:hypothetical protein
MRERRTWKTWQLVAAILVAIFLGMGINGATSSGSSTASGPGSHGSYHLPPASQSPSGTTAAPKGSSATSTTAAGGATTTTAAGGSTSTTTATQQAGAPTVLVPQTTQSGNWTSPAFTIASGTWNIGWAFQCTPAPASSPTFAIFVVNNGGSPGSTPAATSAAASGQSVTPQTSTGSQQVIVQTAASCRWAVKVTGIGG